MERMLVAFKIVNLPKECGPSHVDQLGVVVRGRGGGWGPLLGVVIPTGTRPTVQ